MVEPGWRAEVDARGNLILTRARPRETAPAMGTKRRSLLVGDLVRLLVTWAWSSLTLMVAAWLQPDLSASSPWAYVGVAAVSGVAGLLVRPRDRPAAGRRGGTRPMGRTDAGELRTAGRHGHIRRAALAGRPRRIAALFHKRGRRPIPNARRA